MLKEELMEERRKFPRLDISVGVGWRRVGAEMTQAIDDIDATRNLAEGGVCVVADERFEVGDRLELTLTLPSRKSIRTLGQVVWVKDALMSSDKGRAHFDIGVAFTGLPEGEWQELRHFLYSFP
jgi:hypothetical protein